MEQLFEFIANHPFLVSLWLALAVLLAWNLLSGSVGGVKGMNPAEATRLINHENALLVDIRRKSEYDKGHILGARHFPAAEIDEQIDKLHKQAGDRPVILCCANGMESQRVGRRLQQAGFERVYLIKGGIPGWQQANLPLTREA